MHIPRNSVGYLLSSPHASYPALPPPLSSPSAPPLPLQVRGWQFCAGGLQGFVRDSDADRLVLRRVAECSLEADECLAPPGASRENHNFDQV